MKSLSIIIPTFNDGKIIKNKIISLIKILKKKKLKFEIIIVNDGSTDNTFKKIKSIKHKIKLINNFKNKGKSYSIRKALKKSKYQHVILIDSDLPYFKKFNLIIKKLRESYDLVYINRRHPKSKLIKINSFYGYLRNLVSYLISLLLKILLKITNENIDTQAGLKGFKKTNDFNKIKFLSNKFFLDIELLELYYSRNKKIISIPVTYKISKSSTIKFSDICYILIILNELVYVLFKIIFKKKKS